MTIKTGDAVALCHCGSNGAGMIRTVIVTKVKKTFIEIEGGSRYCPESYRQIRTSLGDPGLKSYFLDPDIASWHRRADIQRGIRELNEKFDNLITAAKARDWDLVKISFANLAHLIGE